MLTIIAAVSKNNCIGKEGRLPWYIPDDLKRFKALTMGKVVLMGRKTWESLPGNAKPLPRRPNVVVTRQADYPLPPGVIRVASLLEALQRYADQDIMVIGGAEIYRQTITLADRLELTRLTAEIAGDVFFPTFDHSQWHILKREEREGYSWVTYGRKV